MLKKSIFGLVAAAFISSLVMSLPGCGGGGGGGTAAAAAPAAPAASCPTCVNFYVNPVTGTSAASGATGTLASPYKTITEAIKMASAVAITSGANINAASGVYNAASGEVFPIKPTNGENLIGSGNVQVVGTGFYTFVAGGDIGLTLPYVMAFSSGVSGSMTGISLSGAQETICADKATVTLTNNTFSGSTDVVFVAANGAKVTLNGNTLNNGAFGGILVADATTKVVARGNIIPNPTQNGVMLGYLTAIPASAVDLGTAASPGNNTIKGGTGGVGLLLKVTAGTTIQAVGNTWKPVQGADPAGHYAASSVAAGTAVVAGWNYANSPNGIIQF